MSTWKGLVLDDNCNFEICDFQLDIAGITDTGFWALTFECLPKIPGLATAITLTALLTDAIKNVVGMPRPNFFHTCFPDGIPVLIHPLHTPLSLSLSHIPLKCDCLFLETLHKKANCCLLQCKQLCNMGRSCSCNSRTALTACSTSEQWKDGTRRCTILAYFMMHWCVQIESNSMKLWATCCCNWKHFE